MRVPKSSVDLLAALIAMVEYKNKIKAAEALGISLSALDKRLRVLSQRMGVKLLNVNEESWTLSEAGRICYPEAVRTLEYALLAEDKTQAHLLLRANHLLVGHSTYLAPKLLAVIRQLEFDPPSLVHIEHRSGFTVDIMKRVLDGTLHAGFGYFPIQHPDLLVRLLLEEPFVVCMPSDHLLARCTQIRPGDLDHQALIAVARETLPALHDEIQEHLASFGITPRIVADAFTPVEALAYVEQKVGLCLLATSSAVAQRGIVIRPFSTRTLNRRSGFFVRDDSRDVLISELTQLVLKRTAKLSRTLV